MREGGRPAVIGHADGPPGSRTVGMLYAHHDVQPPARTTCGTAPFEPTERDGRLYGRGAADDKAGVMAHVAALRAHSGSLPVGVTVFVEGEEEIGSDSLPTILERHGEKLRARRDRARRLDELGDRRARAHHDAARDDPRRRHGEDPRPRRPLRDVRGAVPDALTALIRVLASLHDDEGNVAVAGLKEGVASDLRVLRGTAAHRVGAARRVSTIGSGSLLSRMWTKPSASTIGVDAPSVATSSNTWCRAPPPGCPSGWRPTRSTSRPSSGSRRTCVAAAPWARRS